MKITFKTLAPAGPSIHEAFDIGVLGRFAGVDEIELDVVIIGPSIKCPPAQLRAVIDDQDIGDPLSRATRYITMPFPHLTTT